LIENSASNFTVAYNIFLSTPTPSAAVHSTKPSLLTR